MPKTTNFRGIATPVYRCKECPHAEMGSTRFNWTCAKTGNIIPLSRTAEHCPLPDMEEDSGRRNRTNQT
jgi:hypothetical protein